MTDRKQAGKLTEDDYDDGFRVCPRCMGNGEVVCRCGGDQCYCDNGGDAPCPTCGGDGEVPVEDFNRMLRRHAEFSAALDTALKSGSAE